MVAALLLLLLGGRKQPIYLVDFECYKGRKEYFASYERLNERALQREVRCCGSLNMRGKLLPVVLPRHPHSQRRLLGGAHALGK